MNFPLGSVRIGFSLLFDDTSLRVSLDNVSFGLCSDDFESLVFFSCLAEYDLLCFLFKLSDFKVDQCDVFIVTFFNDFGVVFPFDLIDDLVLSVGVLEFLIREGFHCFLDLNVIACGLGKRGVEVLRNDYGHDDHMFDIYAECVELLIHISHDALRKLTRQVADLADSILPHQVANGLL